MAVYRYRVSPIQNENKKQEHWIRFFIWMWEVAMVLLSMAGIVLQIGTLFDVPYRELSMLRLVFSIMVLLCGLLTIHVRLQRYALLVPAVGLVAIAGYLRGNLLRGFAGALNMLIRLWNLRYQDGKVSLQVEGLTTYDLYMTLYTVLTLIFVFIWISIRTRKALLSVLVLLMLCLPGILLGRVSPHGAVCMLSAFTGVWLGLASGFLDNRRAVWTMGIGVLFALGAVLFNYHLTGVDTLKRAARIEMDVISYGLDTLPQGDLYVAYDMHEDPSKKVRLVVTSEQKKTMYLKGFVGDSYVDGDWKEFTGSTYGNEDSGMLAWLTDRGMLPEAQYVAYDRANQTTVEGNRVHVENHSANRRYVYVPYSAEDVRRGSVVRTNRDNNYIAQRFIGTRAYSYMEYGGELPSELLNVEDWIEHPESDQERAYVESEQVYRDFVYRHYLEVPSNLEILMHRAFHDQEDTPVDSIYTATIKIRSMLEKIVVYDRQGEKIPDYIDPIQWFLTDSGRGNSALYASTAVMAYRSFGIPARYVEGYITNHRTSEAQGVVTYELTSADAHAWCEVYMDGIGWVPVDVTPGFYYDTYAMVQMLESSREIRQTSAQEQSDEAADELLDEQGSAETPVLEDIVHFTKNLAYGLVVIAILIALLFWVICVLLRRWLLYRRAKRLEKSCGTERAKMMWSIITERLLALGIESQIGWEIAKTEAQIRAVLPSIVEGEFAGVNEQMEKVYYGGLPLEPYEEDLLVRFMEKMEDDIIGLSLGARVRYSIKETKLLLFGKEHAS